MILNFTNKVLTKVCKCISLLFFPIVSTYLVFRMISTLSCIKHDHLSLAVNITLFINCGGPEKGHLGGPDKGPLFGGVG